MLLDVDVTAVEPILYLVYLIVCVLFALRTSALIAIDDGPFDAIFLFRVWIGVYDRNENGVAKTWVGRLFGCPHCLGIWIALITALLIFRISLLTPFIWLAIAGGQSWLESMRSKHDDGS